MDATGRADPYAEVGFRVDLGEILLKSTGRHRSGPSTDENDMEHHGTILGTDLRIVSITSYPVSPHTHTSYSPLDPSTIEITYTIWDNDNGNNPEYGPRRMGLVIVPIGNLTSGVLLDKWFDLSPSSVGDTTSGYLHLTVLVLDRKPPGYEVVVIIIGLLLLILSLVWGSYVWRRPQRRRRRPAKPMNTYAV